MAVIAELALRGNPEYRFEELYSACQPRVFRTCLAILRNHDDAAEATQEVFSRALPLITELREPHLWLQTVARNYCLDQLRRQKVRGTGTTLDEDTPGSQRDDPEREAMLRDALRQAFEALTPRERRALGRVLLMDDSLADIAGMLGVSYGAAAQVVSRARRRAAMAARAVIGASLGWLIRIGVPRERGRVSRAAAQVLESSQNLVLAAAVVFTAGTMATQGAALSPAAAGPASGGASVLNSAASLAGGASSATPGATGAVSGAATDARSALPSGLSAATLQSGSTNDRRQWRPDPTNPTKNPPPPQQPGVLLTPQVSTSCAGASASVVAPNGTQVASRDVQVCEP